MKTSLVAIAVLALSATAGSAACSKSALNGNFISEQPALPGINFPSPIVGGKATIVGGVIGDIVEIRFTKFGSNCKGAAAVKITNISGPIIYTLPGTVSSEGTSGSSAKPNLITVSVQYGPQALLWRFSRIP